MMKLHSPIFGKWIERVGGRSAAKTVSVPPTGFPSRSGYHSFSFATGPRSEGHVQRRCWWAQHRVHPKISKASQAHPIPAGPVCRHHHRLPQKAQGATVGENKNRSTVFHAVARGQTDIEASTRLSVVFRSAGWIHSFVPIMPWPGGSDGLNTIGDD